MNRQEIISKLKDTYFHVSELVCDHIYKKYGDTSWEFIDTKQLETIYVLRTQILGVPMTCNNYGSDGSYTQRGVRCNLCSLVKDKTLKGELYLTAHYYNANDFDVAGMTAEQARKKIKDNQHLLPYPVRIEKGVGWLHIDTRNNTNIKVIEFNG